MLIYRPCRQLRPCPLCLNLSPQQMLEALRFRGWKWQVNLALLKWCIASVLNWCTPTLLKRCNARLMEWCTDSLLQCWNDALLLCCTADMWHCYWLKGCTTTLLKRCTAALLNDALLHCCFAFSMVACDIVSWRWCDNGVIMAWRWQDIEGGMIMAWWWCGNVVVNLLRGFAICRENRLHDGDV